MKSVTNGVEVQAQCSNFECFVVGLQN